MKKVYIRINTYHSTVITLPEKTFKGQVKRCGKPKIYKNPWGINRRYFVEFTNGQRAMCTPTIELKEGDIVEIDRYTENEDWLNINEGTIVNVIKNETEETDLRFAIETGYMTNPATINGVTVFRCFWFKTEDGLLEKKVRVLYFPEAVVWLKKGSFKPPAFSSTIVKGKIIEDRFEVSEIESEIPLQRNETIVLKMSDLKFHKNGADFWFTFGKELFTGTIKPPFYTSSLYNLFTENVFGFIEITGTWFKNGNARKKNGDWVEETFWVLEEGKEFWNPETRKNMETAIATYEGMEEFSEMYNQYDIIDFKKVSEKAKALGFKTTPEDVEWWFWRLEFNKYKIEYLKRITEGIYQTVTDLFFFRVRKSSKAPLFIVTDAFRGDIYIVLEKDFPIQAKEIFDNQSKPDFNLPVFRRVEMDRDWETNVLTAILEMQESK